MPLAPIKISPGATSPILGKNFGQSSDSVLFSKKVLAPLGVTVASALGVYCVYRYRKAQQERREAEEDQTTFRSSRASPTTTTNNNNKGPSSGSVSAVRNGDKKGPTQALTAEEEQRRKALDDLMRIIGGFDDEDEAMGNAKDFDADEAEMMRALMRGRGRGGRKGHGNHNKKKKGVVSAVEELDDDDEEGEGTTIAAKKDKKASGEEVVDEYAYINRFFEFDPISPEYASARSYCLAAVEAALAQLDGRKPKSAKKKGGKEEDSDFEDEESNPDPILQVATSIEVDLRHRLEYFAQELGFSVFKEGEEARLVCATYAGPIPRPANVPKGPISMRILLEAVKEYLEVCIEIDRTKPVVVDMAKHDAVTDGREKDMWKQIADRDRGGEEGHKGKGNSKEKKTKKNAFMDTYESDGDGEGDADDDALAFGNKGATAEGQAKEMRRALAASNRSKEASIGRMLAAREKRFMGAHVAEQMDHMLQERQAKMMRIGNGAAAAGARQQTAAHDDEDYDDESFFEEDNIDEDHAYIGEPLHDTNRRAYEAALIRAVLGRISSEDDPATKPHLAVVDEVAKKYKEPSEAGEEVEEVEEEEEGGWDLDDEDDPYGFGYGSRGFGHRNHHGHDDEWMYDDYDDDADFDEMMGDEYDDDYDYDGDMPFSRARHAEGGGGGRAGAGFPLDDDERRRAMMMQRMMMMGAMGRGPQGYHRGHEDHDDDDEDLDAEEAAFEAAMHARMMRARGEASSKDEEKAKPKAKTFAKKSFDAPETQTKKEKKQTQNNKDDDNNNKKESATTNAEATTSEKASAVLQANINMMLQEGGLADLKALFLEDDDDESEYEDYVSGEEDDDEEIPTLIAADNNSNSKNTTDVSKKTKRGGNASVGQNSDEQREAFIREMIEREAAEYNAMRETAAASSRNKGETNGGKHNKKGKGKNAKAVDNDDEEEDEWVDY